MLRRSTLVIATIATLGTAGCVGTAQQLQPGQLAYGDNPYARTAPAQSNEPSAFSRFLSGGRGGGSRGGTRSSSRPNTGLPFNTDLGTAAVLFGGI